MAEGKLVAHVWCRACGRQAELDPAALGGRTGPDLYRRLRCKGCGALGRGEVRLVWSLAGEVNPLAGMPKPERTP